MAPWIGADASLIVSRCQWTPSCEPPRGRESIHSYRLVSSHFGRSFGSMNSPPKRSRKLFDVTGATQSEADKRGVAPRRMSACAGTVQAARRRAEWRRNVHLAAGGQKRHGVGLLPIRHGPHRGLVQILLCDRPQHPRFGRRPRSTRRRGEAGEHRRSSGRRRYV